MNLKGNNNIIPLLAICVLIIGSVSTLYVHANQSFRQTDADSIIINDQSLDVSEIFSTYPNMTIETDIGEKIGVSLSEILLSTDIECLTCHSYILKAKDGYQQTVNGNDMQKGIITLEKRAYFPHLAHAFWVGDIIEIEVE